MQCALLPPEIWTQIFFWATYGPARELDVLLAIPIFDSINYRATEKQYVLSLGMKHTLALVCTEWRSLTEVFMYEDLRIRHGACALANVLENSKKSDSNSIGHGRYVRRISLPLMKKLSLNIDYDWENKVVRRIIDCCPNLLVFSRYRSIFVKEEDEEEDETNGNAEPGYTEGEWDPVMPAVGRIDWNTGLAFGIQRMVSVPPRATWVAQSLQVLSLSGDNYFWSPEQLQSMSIVLLPRVHTLRIGSVYTFGVPGVDHYRMDLPALRRIILDKAEVLHRLIDSCLRAHGEQVREIEVAAYWRFLRSDYISALLNYCSNVEVLHFPIFWVRVLRWRQTREMPNCVLRGLTHIGLHAAANPEIELARAEWQQIKGHFNAIFGANSRLPAIRRVTLHGEEWTSLVSDFQFQWVLQLAQNREVEIFCEDTISAAALNSAKSSFALEAYLKSESGST
ncbi:hypothetical protein EW145_g6174 [Phellinidium pouzarii]|uniref:F-box domain-containing protein n=1 Tax=Phellinidium pouzarii TaxID=167371 RepID=A0A4S4KXF4_9AGAM|nr:hypothetical protein EW145_g6174 [Phellinidium pouzarii]